MRYLVTGATGFIGGRIVEQLRARNDDVVALVRSPRKATRLADLGVSILPGDITERSSVARAVEGVDGVFHVAAWYKIGAPQVRTAEAVNVEGSRNVLESALEAGVKRIVHTSTVAVFSDTHGRLVDESYRFTGRHLTLYDRTKAAAHNDVAEPLMKAGAPLVIVLPGVVYGPGDRSALGASFQKYLRGELHVIPTRTAYCWSHVDDAACVQIAAMDRGQPGHSYIVAGPAHDLTEAFALAEQITGIPAPRRVPAGLFRIAALCMRPISSLFRLPQVLHPESLLALSGRTYLGDDRKAREQLGFNPRPLENGLRETMAHAAEPRRRP